MHNDDRQMGRILTRRQSLRLLGATGAALILGCSRNDGGTIYAEDTGPCVVKPEQTEGPYFSDVQLNRSDIRSNPATGVVKEGAGLDLTIRLSNAGAGCVPLGGVVVDVWHCDALGSYSDFAREKTAGQAFLRGHQVTDSKGEARFKTIYPGWYEGRTVHIHFKVRTNPSSFFGKEFTSQLYFDDALTDIVHSQAPYSAKGRRRMRNAQDGIFRDGGSRLLLNAVKTSQGYASVFEMAVQL